MYLIEILPILSITSLWILGHVETDSSTDRLFGFCVILSDSEIVAVMIPKLVYKVALRPMRVEYLTCQPITK